MPPSYIERKSTGMSCFAKGCVGIAVIAVILFIGLWVGGFYIQRTFGAFVSERQVALRSNDTSNEQYQAALRKLQPLLMEAPGQTPMPIIVTADDLNALVAHDKRLTSAKDKCYFTIPPGSQMAVDVSTELPQNSGSRSKVYYTNVRLIGDVNIAAGAVRIEPRKIESLNGREFPSWAMNNSVFQAIVDSLNRDINKSIRDNTDLSDIVAKIASTKVENGHLTIIPVGAAEAPVSSASPVAAPSSR